MKGINTLFSNGCYDSIFSIARQYLEGYALCSYSIEKYNDKEFDELFEKLLLVDSHQDIKVYEGLPTNFTSKEKDKYLDRWENEIKVAFPNEYQNINSNDRENSLKTIIKNLLNRSKNKFSIIGNKTNFTYQELCKISKINIGDLGRATYPILCSETHFNISSVMTSVLNDGLCTINMNNEERAKGIIEIIIYAHETLLESFYEFA